MRDGMEVDEILEVLMQRSKFIRS